MPGTPGRTITGGETYGLVAFTAREREVAGEHGASTNDPGRLFYEHFADVLKKSQPVGSYSQRCPGGGTVVPDPNAAQV